MDRTSPKKSTTPSGENDAVTRTRSGSSSSASKNKARKSNSLPLETVEYLKAWMMSPEHIAHPYPTEQEKAQIMSETGIELKQLTNWFVNNRKRYWKPRVEARLQDTPSQGAVSVPVPTVVTPSKQPETVSVISNFSHMASPLVSSFLETKPVSKITPSPSSSSLSLQCSPARVSDQSVSSESDSMCSSDDEIVSESSTAGGQQTTEEPSCLLSQTEYVNVHILRPSNGNTPTIDDVTILHNVPSDLVLKTYVDCPLTYTVPSNALSNNQKVSIPHVPFCFFTL
jgi:Homeobox KN domain